LTNSIETLKKELYDFTGTRINLENKVVQLKNQLESNLRPRKLELQKQLESNSIESNWDLIMMQSNQDIQSLQSFINTTETTLSDSINQVEEYKQNLEELKSEIENYKTIRSGQAIELEEHHQEVSKYLSMKDINLQKKNEYQKNIRNLGVLPEEAFSRYMKTPSQKVDFNMYIANIVYLTNFYSFYKIFTK
jgi:structural maintenance of chromosome 3 (chondroitin sulfate proteoglycan 6)